MGCFFYAKMLWWTKIGNKWKRIQYQIILKHINKINLRWDRSDLTNPFTTYDDRMMMNPREADNWIRPFSGTVREDIFRHDLRAMNFMPWTIGWRFFYDTTKSTGSEQGYDNETSAWSWRWVQPVIRMRGAGRLWDILSVGEWGKYKDMTRRCLTVKIIL